MKQRLKDVTHDQYGYEDDEATTEELKGMAMFLLFLIGLVCLGMGGLLWTLYSIADWIFK